MAETSGQMSCSFACSIDERVSINKSREIAELSRVKATEQTLSMIKLGREGMHGIKGERAGDFHDQARSRKHLQDRAWV